MLHIEAVGGMQISAAIRALEMQMFRLIVAKDAAGIMAFESQQPGNMLIGTDPSEWLTSYAAIEQVVRAGVEFGSGGRMPDSLEILAFEEGTVGWANVRYTTKLSNGGSYVIRWSHVFHQEGGTWKLVNDHTSLGVPDDKVMTFFAPS